MFISKIIGHAGSYTLHEQPKTPSRFQRAFASVKPQARAPAQPGPGPEDHLSSVRFKSPTFWDKFKNCIARIGKPTLKQQMRDNATSRVIMSHESFLKAFASESHDAALKTMRAILDKDNPVDAEMSVASWEQYEGVIANEIQPIALQDKLSLAKRLEQFLQSPEEIQPKRNLAMVVNRLATVAPVDAVKGLPEQLAPRNEMLEAAREASLITPQMTKIGAAAAEASEWFRSNGNKPMPAGSTEFLKVQALCESLLAAIDDIRFGRDIGRVLVAAQATSVELDHDGDIGEPNYFTIPGPQPVSPVALSAAKVSVATAVDQKAVKEEPIYAKVPFRDKSEAMKVLSQRKELKKFHRRLDNMVSKAPALPQRTPLRLEPSYPGAITSLTT